MSNPPSLPTSLRVADLRCPTVALELAAGVTLEGDQARVGELVVRGGELSAHAVTARRLAARDLRIDGAGLSLGHGVLEEVAGAATATLGSGWPTALDVTSLGCAAASFEDLRVALGPLLGIAVGHEEPARLRGATLEGLSWGESDATLGRLRLAHAALPRCAVTMLHQHVTCDLETTDLAVDHRRGHDATVTCAALTLRSLVYSWGSAHLALERLTAPAGLAVNGSRLTAPEIRFSRAALQAKKADAAMPEPPQTLPLRSAVPPPVPALLLYLLDHLSAELTLEIAEAEEPPGTVRAAHRVTLPVVDGSIPSARAKELAALLGTVSAEPPTASPSGLVPLSWLLAEALSRSQPGERFAAPEEAAADARGPVRWIVGGDARGVTLAWWDPGHHRSTTGSA